MIERLGVRVPGELSSPELNFLCSLSFSIHFNPVFAQWHIKDPAHSAKKKKQVAGVILQKKQVAGYTYTHIYIHHWPIEIRVGRLCCQGKV